MAETITPHQNVVPTDEWHAEIERLHQRERDAQRTLDDVKAQRQRLPMVEVTTDYAFEGAPGPAHLSDLFNGQPQLVVYHFMYAPEWESGCPGCTGYVKGIGDTTQLRKQETEFVLVSRAPIENLRAWKDMHGWTMPWYSGETRFSDDMGALPGGNDMPAINVFVKDDNGRIYRSYVSSGPSLAMTMGQRALLDLTPRGADPLG